MKNSTLLFRSLAIIIFLAGSAHLIRLGYSYTEDQPNYNGANNDNKIKNSTADESIAEDFDKKETNTKKTNNYDENIDYIIGKWIVNYRSEEFNGAIVYDLRKENQVFNAYTLEYQDIQGNSQKADGNKVLTIKKFDGYKGSGIYKIEYEGEEYKVDCSIDMVDENIFKLSYEYYGYGDIETWKRQ
ncbi:hypothetical protein [Aquimarina sp. 2201CG14-23]|uniref:hypothetical protein n=1 Tax=Aquimarina mycalae TaxID=3040073 RepID=UPI0024780C19|nr:hypothetical protein [Aquimarina sp. 2201CG14-23]MDH7447559.1 hypothetical protein [Aquimarina sp. 2201CG14-23]